MKSNIATEYFGFHAKARVAQRRARAAAGGVIKK
jgi:hypothetical protein